ncbi:hypothetical protein GHT06_011228 [Daphnia sinensis]|uniref:Uncharacterized protein n=1 Tax=Daphnia sinensis TaxID=1820382 RepID=A0AAD5KZL7_9CRUS|nr:hypothetical protein GHT06_011228 [Daphnia sinensis]
MAPRQGRKGILKIDIPHRQFGNNLLAKVSVEYMRPLIVFLIVVSILMCWNSHPASAAVLATIRSQEGGSKRTFVLDSIRPSTPKFMVDASGSKNVSLIEQVNSSALYPPSQSADPSSHLSQQKNRQGKPLFMDVNVILNGVSPIVLSTETPSTTTVLNDHYATTIRGNDDKRSSSDQSGLFEPDSARKTSHYGLKKDSKAMWLLTDEEDEDIEESEDYEVVDLNQSSGLSLIDRTFDEELNPSQFKTDEEDPNEDIILVIGQLSTMSPITPVPERTEGNAETALKKEGHTSEQIGLSEWPVQIGLQARSKPAHTIKPVEFPTDNLNKQQMSSGTQESRGQQPENTKTKLIGQHNSSVIVSYRNKGNFGNNSNGSSDDVRPNVRSQFMDSRASNIFSYETGKKSEDFEMNHYGNPDGGKPMKTVTSTTTSKPEKSKHYNGSHETRKQETSTTTESDEPFYYLDSEEESGFEYLDEEERVEEPIADAVNTPRTIVRPQSSASPGRPPYFVNPSVIPLDQPLDLGNDFEAMNPTKFIKNRMDVDSNNGITFVDDAIQPVLVLPFPADHILMNPPNLDVKPQPLISTALHPIGETLQKNTFLVNYDHSLPSAQPLNTMTSSNPLGKAGTVKPPSAEMLLKGMVYEKHSSYSIPEETKTSDEIKSYPIKTIMTNVYEDPITIHQGGLPLHKTSSSTQVQSVHLSQPTKPMASSKSPLDASIVPTNQARPFVQTGHITRSANKAGSGPYFVSSAETGYRSYSHPIEDEIIRPTIENNRNAVAKRDEGIIGRSSASAGRPPYFVTSTEPTSVNLASTKPPRNINTQYENSNSTLLNSPSHDILHPSLLDTNAFTTKEHRSKVNEKTTTTRVPVEKTAGHRTDTFDISFGPVRPTIPYILSRSNAARPIQPSYPSSPLTNVERRTTERILDIDPPLGDGMKLSIGNVPNPIGISNKNNVFVVPKQKANETVRTPVPSTTVSTILSTNKPGTSNNKRERTTATIINHNMGSFVVTSSPVRSSVQPTYTSRPVTIATTPTTKESDIMKPVKSEDKTQKIDFDYPVQENLGNPTAVLQNPIGISNKDNVFVVPKMAKGIIRAPIRSNAFPADTLMKRQSFSINSELQTSTRRPFERIVSHQMGSFVVTPDPQLVQQSELVNTASKETIGSPEIPEFLSLPESAIMEQPTNLAKNSTQELMDSNPLKTGKSDHTVGSRTGIGRRNTSAVGPVVQPSLGNHPLTGQLINSPNTNKKKQQHSRISFRHPNRRTGKRSVSPRLSRDQHDTSIQQM